MNDQTNWNPDPDVGSFEFKDAAEAKRAEGIINRMMRESWENGRQAGLREASRPEEATREQLRLANIDQANTEAELNDAAIKAARYDWLNRQHNWDRRRPPSASNFASGAGCH